MKYSDLKTPKLTEQLLAIKQSGKKGFAVLLDPDKLSISQVQTLVDLAVEADVTYFFVGGSLLVNDEIHKIVPEIKRLCNIPVILFPGSPQQIVPSADAIFFLSLISGRNPDLLIGNHVLAAPFLKKTDLQVIPTGYLLVESGKMTTVNYISNTFPIPRDKADIAVCTAMAGEMLGLKVLYMDGGSGATYPIPAQMIKAVAQNVDIPVIVGGGIRTPEAAAEAWEAGADIIVVGNAIENPENILLMNRIANVMKNLNQL